MPSNIGMAFLCESCGNICPARELDPFAEQAGRKVCYDCVDGYLLKGADQFNLKQIQQPDRKLLYARRS